jgi:hypothetical protein
VGSFVTPTTIIDSGASIHLTGDPSCFVPGTIRNVRIPIRVANGDCVYTISCGDVLIESTRGSVVTHMLLTDVHYVKALLTISSLFLLFLLDVVPLFSTGLQRSHEMAKLFFLAN